MRLGDGRLDAAGSEVHEQQEGVALVCTSANGWELAHHGLLHPPSADVTDILTPLIAERLARREPVLAALSQTTAAQLHNRLPTTAGLHTINEIGRASCRERV